MGLKCGIIGLPNVGKSTLFNAMTKAEVETANFPFCTISPHIGIVPIQDPRMQQLKKIVNPQRTVHSIIEFVDIAGLIKGAHKGEGLGNKFLTNIRETEAIIHVVRCFEDKNIVHVTGKISPEKDVDIINTELMLSDLETCDRAIYCAKKRSKGGEKDANIELSLLQKCLLHLSDAIMLRTIKFSKEEKKRLRHLNFLTLKPMMYIANISEEGYENNPYLDILRTISYDEGSVVVALCASIESDIAKLEKKEQEEFIAEMNLNQIGLSNVARACYKLLNLHTYFTVGKKEIRAWTIPIGTTASKAAGKIHTDFERGFIRAKTISFNDFISFNGELGAKEAGKIRSEGKEYIVKDGDIMNFLFKA